MLIMIVAIIEGGLHCDSFDVARAIIMTKIFIIKMVMVIMQVDDKRHSWRVEVVNGLVKTGFICLLKRM